MVKIEMDCKFENARLAEAVVQFTTSTWVSKVIDVYLGFLLLRLVIGLKTRQFLANQK